MKLLLKLSALFIALLVAAVVIVVTVVDPNDYKQQIQEQAKKQLNRELLIEGDLSWSLYPVLGFNIGKTELYNPETFSEKIMLAVDQGAISINVLPLLSGQVEIGEVILDGVKVNLITNADGTTNLDNLGSSQQSEKTDEQAADQNEATKEDDSSSQLSDLQLSGVSITNTELQVINHLNNTQQHLQIKSFNIGEFAFNKRTPISLTSSFSDKQLSTDVELKTELFINKSLTELNLHGLQINSQLTTQALPDTQINSALSGELLYQLKAKNLAFKQFKLQQTFSGKALNGDINLSADNIKLDKLQELTIDKLTLLSELTGELTQHNQVNTNLQSQISADLNKQTAQINGFKLNKQIKGQDLNADIKLTLQALDVQDFKKVLIKQLNLTADAKGEQLPSKAIKAQFNSDVSYDLDTQKLSLSALKMQLDKLKLDGSLTVVNAKVPQVRYQLAANVWDLNPYLPKQQAAQSDAASSPETQTEQEPDLSILNNLDIKGDLSLSGLLYQDIKIGKITQRLIVKNGKAQLAPMTANLYGGNLNMNAWLDDAKGKNQYSSNIKVKTVQMMPLLKDAAKIDILSGTANFNVQANGQGLIASKIQKQIKAKGDFKISDGEIYGINIPKEIRLMKAKLTGKTLPVDKQVKKTDFASLIGQFTVSDGIANNQKLLMLSPVMRLDGAGKSDTIKQSIDYKLGVTPLDKSDEKTDYLDLSGVTIPLLITGTYTKPKFNLDTDGAVKAQIKANKKALKKKAQKALQDKIQGGSNQDLKEEAKKLESQFKSFFK